MLRNQMLAALRALATFTLLVGVAYPLAMTGITSVAFPHAAGGSIVERDGEPVGSELIGQAFTGEEWFHPRPSAAGEGYDAEASAPSNLGPTNRDLLDAIDARARAYRQLNGLAADADVPVDAVTSSGSGLDPHISVANALLQADRVARENALPVDRVIALVHDRTEGRTLGFLGEEGVNVLLLNVAIADAVQGRD